MRVIAAANLIPVLEKSKWQTPIAISSQQVKDMQLKTGNIVPADTDASKLAIIVTDNPFQGL